MRILLSGVLLILFLYVISAFLLIMKLLYKINYMRDKKSALHVEIT